MTTKPSAPTPAKRSPARSRNAKPRIAAEGDISPVHTRKGVETFTVDEAVSAAQESKVVAVKDILSGAGNGSPEMIESLKAILAGASPEDAEALRNALLARPPLGRTGMPFDPDGELADDWREGGYRGQDELTRGASIKHTSHRFEPPRADIPKRVMDATPVAEQFDVIEYRRACRIE